MSKSPSYQPPPPTACHDQPHMYSVRGRGLKLLAAVVVLLVVLAPCRHDIRSFFDVPHRSRTGSMEPQRWSDVKATEEGEWKVPLEAHIMSKCPDARDCLVDLVVPVMALLSPKINFTLSYIGTPTDPDDGVECMHGPGECLGNIIELCAANVYPDPKVYLGFTMCLSRRYEQIPSRALISDCSMEYGIDFEKLNECASKDDGSFGIGLLRDSVQRSKSFGVTASCTVRLNNEVRCIRDGGEWKNCDKGSTVDSLADEVERLYKEKNEN